MERNTKLLLYGISGFVAGFVIRNAVVKANEEAYFFKEHNATESEIVNMQDFMFRNEGDPIFIKLFGKESDSKLIEISDDELSIIIDMLNEKHIAKVREVDEIIRGD